MKQRINEQIVSFVSSTDYSDLPHELPELIIEEFIEYTANTISGCKKNSVNDTLKYAKYNSNKEEAKVFGRDERTSAEFASMINATASQRLDYDDIKHPTIIIAPVCFAMAEKYKRSGKDMILAFALAVEVMHKLVDKTVPKLLHIVCSYGVVIAGAVLKRSSKEELLNALEIVTSKNFETNRSYHTGMTCYKGLEALYLASIKTNYLNTTNKTSQIFISKKEKSFNLKLGMIWSLLKRDLICQEYHYSSNYPPYTTLVNDIIDKYNFSSKKEELKEKFLTSTKEHKHNKKIYNLLLNFEIVDDVQRFATLC